MTPPVLELSDVVKDYQGLRPLRIQRLRIAAGRVDGLMGFDRPMAETLVNLVTGATLPDRGDVNVFGRPTAAVNDSAEWLALVDRFGIVSERAVLLDALSVIQNLAMPFTLEIEPPSRDIRRRPSDLPPKRDCPNRRGIVPSPSSIHPAGADSSGALALDPAVVILEHPTAGLARAAVAPLGRSIRMIASDVVRPC